MENEINIVEKTKLRDVIEALKDIFVGEKVKDEGNMEQKLQEIYKVEKEIGGTANIASLEKDVQQHGEKRNKKMDKKGTKTFENRGGHEEIENQQIENQGIEKNLDDDELSK